ncbi:MAG TPA: T9SS type A sorting domain-containing protein, partial [Cryomorphaceae bacterium]|nr:T9SS type A sorting domain-containing protein [Cryomorphaceae bacterium]
FSHSTFANAEDIKVRALELATCGSNNFDIDYDHPNVSGGSPLALRLEPLAYTGGGLVDVDFCPLDFPSEDDCPIINSAAPPGKDVVGDGKSGESDAPETLSQFEVIIEEFYGEINAYENLDGSDPYLPEEYRMWNTLIRAVQWDSIGNFPKEDVFELLNQYEPTEMASRFASALAEELGFETPAWVNSQDNFNQTNEEAALSGVEAAGLPYEIDEVMEASYFNSASNTAAFVKLYHENDKIFEPIPMIIEAELPDTYGVDEDKSNRSESDVQIVSVRPNPFDQNFMIGFESSQEYDNARIVFYDLLGRTISDNSFGEISQVEIDGSEFPSGVLIYSVYLDGKLFDTGRIVKAE